MKAVARQRASHRSGGAGDPGATYTYIHISTARHKKKGKEFSSTWWIISFSLKPFASCVCSAPSLMLRRSVGATPAPYIYSMLKDGALRCASPRDRNDIVWYLRPGTFLFLPTDISALCSIISGRFSLAMSPWYIRLPCAFFFYSLASLFFFYILLSKVFPILGKWSFYILSKSRSGSHSNHWRSLL